MKSKGTKVVLSILALAISGLVTAAHAQRNVQGPQTVVKFKFGRLVLDGAQSIDAYGISNKHVIVGDYMDGAGQQHGLYFKGLIPLGGPSCPGYKDTAYSAVNTAGIAVVDCSNGGARAEVRGDGPQTPCGNPIPCIDYYIPNNLIIDPNPPCDCPYTVATINDLAGNPGVGGSYQDTQGLTHGYLSQLQRGAMQTLDVPGALNSSVWGLNNAGQAVLQAQDAAGQTHSYLFDGTSFRNIDVPGAVLSLVHGINNNGDMVYTVEDANGGLWGVLFVQWLNQYYWFNQPDGRKEATQAYGLNDEVPTFTGTKLQLVGGYTVPGSPNHYAFRANVNIAR